jgi:hypothetical protein
MNSVISVEGVPGYAYTPLMPACTAPRAMASSPNNNLVGTIIALDLKRTNLIIPPNNYSRFQKKEAAIRPPPVYDL